MHWQIRLNPLPGGTISDMTKFKEHIFADDNINLTQK